MKNQMKFAILALFVFESVIFAQYTPNYNNTPPAERRRSPAYGVPGPGPWGPWGGGWYNYAAGGRLTGAANVIDAQGQFMQDQEQARLQREQVNRSKLDTRKATMEEMWYERENRPTYSDDRERDQRLQLRAALKNPPTNEITSGRAMNQLLQYCQSLSQNGHQGPPVPIDPSMLKDISFTVGTAGNPSLLTSGLFTSPPIALRGPIADDLHKNINEAIERARSDTLTVDLIMQINTDVAKMEKKLSDDIRASKIDTTMWLNGTRYMTELKDSLRVLQQPNAAQVLGGAYQVTADSVGELVYAMTRKGLKFAPALQGREGAYLSLHDSMTSFAMAASPNDSAFRIRLSNYPTSSDSKTRP